VDASWYLLCLGDIFFESPPFDSLAAMTDKAEHVDGCLLTGLDALIAAGEGTGFVAWDGSGVHAIAYKPGPDWSHAREGCRRWSGAFFFTATLAEDLVRHAATYHLAPLEQWVAGLLERGARCTWVEAGSFINVNSAEDHASLVTRCGNAGRGVAI
jgi:hypothetical protein